MAKWLSFQSAGASPSGKTRRWDVRSKASGATLGTIYWWPKWRQYVFEPDGAAVIIFEEDCLRDIAVFVEERTREHKAAQGAATGG